MKIWKVELILYYNDNGEYETRFYFKSLKENYEENKQFKEWISSEGGWVNDKIPQEMTIEKFIYLKVVQGFDHELTKNELKKIEKDMKIFMKKHLEYEKDLFLKNHKNKLKAIRI